MKIFLQLLREFWLPLIAGIIWTIYNLADKSVSDWSLKDAVNVFGPTFFFASWLAAQWYRVRKQQRVEDDLAKLHEGLQALQAPLLPCALFLTLKFVATDEDLKRIFEGCHGYRAYGPEIPLPDLPFGPPPGMSEGRLQLQGAYIDFRDGFATAAGVYRVEHPDYNTFHASLSHTFCRFDPRTMKQKIWENDPFFVRPTIKIDVFPSRPSTSKVAAPALTLQAGMGVVSEAIAVYAIDNNVLVDFAPRELAVSPPDAAGWSLRSLEGSLVKFEFDFFYIKGINDLPSSSWPSIHNLQLVVGGGRQILTFPPERFKEKQAVVPAQPFAHGAAVCPKLELEFNLTPNVYSTSISSRPSK